MPDEPPLSSDTQVFTYLSPGGWATRSLAEVLEEPPVRNTLVAWHVGEPKAPAYEGQEIRFVNSRRLSEETIWEAERCASRVWWARLLERSSPGLHGAIVDNEALLARITAMFPTVQQFEGLGPLLEQWAEEPGG